MFKIKDGYKLELYMLETIKLFSRTQKLMDQNEGWWKCTESRNSWSKFSTTQLSRQSILTRAWGAINFYTYLFNVEPGT